MYTKKLLLFFIFLIFIIIHCNLFEPENDKGSINIKLTSETESTKLPKSQETLDTVHCTVKKGSRTIHDKDHSKNSSGSFNIKIEELEPADNYSVLLYGKNYSGNIIGRAYTKGINVKAGEEKNVSMSWSDMRPELSSPEDKSTITDSTPTFNWSSVNGAAYYNLEVDNTSSFSSPEINKNSLTSSGYTASSSLSENTYYWRVRAKDSQGSWCEWSNTWNFIISPKTITVTSPNGGESWELGTIHTITWTSSNAGNYVKIELYKNSNFYKTISNSTDNDSSYDWSIPSDYDDYNSYKIKIISTSDTEIYDYSDGYFSLTKTYIEVTSPNGGENWELGTNHIIEWNSSNSGSHVKIELYKQSNFYKLIKNSDVNDDSCYWSIPSDYDEYNNYKIKLTSITDAEIYDFSDDYFSLVYSDPFEPNNSRTEAENISFSGTPPTWQSGSGPEINPSTDQDWFSFSASPGDSIIVFCNVTSQLDPEIVLYFGGTRVLNMDATFSGENETLTYIVPSGNDKTYYVGIGYYSNISKSSGVLANTGSYTLEIRKVPDTTGPESPDLISPDNGSTTTDNTPTFDWSDVNGAAVYELEVDTSSSFYSRIIDENNITSSNYTHSNSLSFDTYYWRVRCKDNQGTWSDWSDTWSFTIENPSQLIAYYPFNGNANDESGNGNDGTVHGATLTTDRFGKTNSAYNFDGDDWIDIPDDISPENISLCGWVYPDNFDNINSSPIITKETGTGTGPTFGWRLNILKNTHQIQYQISTTDRWIGIYSTTELQQNQWYHVIGTFDGSNMKLFINGILEADTTIIPSGKLNQTTMPAAIGHLQGWSVQWFYGKIDDIRIYNYALSQSEIETLYQEGGWPDEETVTDIDGNTYKTVKIDNQWWMAENLKVTHYRNGDPIPNVTNNSDWTGLTTGAHCAYNNNESTTNTYGYLYNWFAVDDSRKIAPEGWHVPTDEEWKQLEMYLGMSQSEADDTGWRGSDEGGKLKESGTTHWNSPNTGATNETGFTALPGGFRYSYGNFGQMNYGAYFWSATEYNNDNAWRRLLIYSSSNSYRNYANKHEGFSIRCIKDN